MKYIKLNGVLYLFALTLLLVSCNNDTQKKEHSHTSDSHTHGDMNTSVKDSNKSVKTYNNLDSNAQNGLKQNIKTSSDKEHKEGAIILTQRQIEAIHLELGDFSFIKISDYVKASGTLGLPPDAYSSVSAKVDGFIKRANKYVEGNVVKKGAIIAYLENPVLIEKQELLLSANAELTYLTQEYNRQKALLEANAGIERDVQKLFSEVEMKKAQKLGAQHYLEYIGINASDVLSGKFIQSIPIIAPISGFITSIDMHNGMFVKPEQQLLEIVSDHHLHLELDVFERDIAKIKVDQQITYIVPALGNDTYKGEVHVIGKEFNPNNKTVRVHGHLNGDKPKFIKDLFISAKIWLNDQKVQALPEESIMKDGSSFFIYYTRNGNIENEVELEFEKAMVIPGVTDNGFVEINLMHELPENTKIVTKGAYFIYAQSKYGEAVHEH